MPFKYTVVDTDKIVFARLQSGCGQVMFISIGSLFTVIGVCLLIFSDSPEMPLAAMRYLFPVMGLLAVFVGIKLPEIQSKSTPDTITFDNTNGRIEVFQKASGIQSAFMYYDEIEDIIYKAKSHTSSSSSTSSSRTTYTYHVYLVKKDGAQWELLRFNSEQDAVVEIVKLKLLIKLQNPPQRKAINIEQSLKFKINSDSSRAELNWRNSVGMAPLYLLLFSIVFCGVFYAILSSGFFSDDFPVFAYFVIGFIGIVFLIVVGGNARKMIKNSKTIYAVSISGFSLDYQEKDLAGRIRKEIRFPLADLHAISFSFDTESTYRKIFIYTHEQFTKMHSLKISLSFEAIREMYKFYSGLVSLDMQDLTAVEALHIENYIQKEIAERGNAKVA
jgi:hypothetical protein